MERTNETITGGKQMDELEQWEQVDSSAAQINVEDLDEMVRKLRALRDEYEAKKKLSSEAHDAYEQQEALVINTLQSLKKSKYELEGVATVSISHRESYTTPKTIDDKNKLFTYIKEKYGPDALMTMVSINSQSLNAWANKESDTGVMQIPGLGAPVATETLSLRRK